MKNYEVLFILPGTLSEDEVGPVAAKVKDAVEKAGAVKVSLQDLGKSRIAYPIKHIRYGYFHLCQFELCGQNVANLRKQLGLMPELLRVVVRAVTAGGEVFEKISAISDVTVREVEPAKTGYEKKFKREEHIEASHQLDSESQKSRKTELKTKVKTETKAEDIKLEDIDKKLDELLEKNMADV